MNKTVYSKYVYLFELDSVRTSPAEIKQAIKALYTETVYNRNIVVLSFNQVVDSLPFISMMTNEKSYEDLFRLFENGYIKISQYKSTRTIIQYLLQKITPLLDSARRSEKPFVFSALPVNSSQRRLLSLIRRCLINSDLTELNEYVEGKRSETELRDLFVEVYPVRNEKADETVSFERIGDCYIIPVSSDVTVKELKNNLSALGIILSHLLRLSTVDDIYLSPRDEKEYKAYTLSTFLDLAHSSLLMSDENYAKAIQFIDENIESKRYEQKPRSFYYEQFQRLETDEKDKTVYRYAEAIINNCYNYACEFSMQNISKHYNVNEDGSIDLQSFCCDFQKRLEEQVKNMQCCMEKAKTASDHFEFCDISEFPRIDHLLKPDKWTTYIEEDKKVPRYEYKADTRFNRLHNKRTYDTRIKVRKVLLAILLYGVINFYLQESIGPFLESQHFFSFIGPTMISLISLMIGEIIVSVCENILPDYVSSLSEIITDMHHYLHNERINKKFIFKSYRNTEAGNDYKTEELSGNMIPRIYSPELTEYRKLRGNTKFFKDPENKEYPLIDIESMDITRAEELTGKKYGVIYKSPYNTLVVDPIADKKRKIFPYERILPAGMFSGEYAGVVIVPVYQDSLILLKQFRHAVREEQLCFPRGFSESINIEEDVKREIEEELGVTVNGSITQIGTLTPDSGLSAGVAAICTVQVKELPHQTHTEGILSYRLVSEAELEAMIKHLDIVDGFTIGAFKMWQSYKSAQ